VTAILFLLAAFILDGPGLALGDYAEAYGRHRHLLRHSLLEHGVFPLWNPYNFSGHPFVGDLLVAPFYPTMALYVLLPEGLSLPLDLGLHMAVGALGTRLLCRRLGVGSAGAAVAGLLFLTMPPWIGHIWAGHLQHVQALAWLPWLYLAAELLRAGELRRAWPAAVLCTGAIVGSGGVPIAWMGLLFLPAWLLLRQLSSPARRGAAAWRRFLHPRGWRELSQLVGAICAGFGLAAANLLPAVYYTHECGRISNTVGMVAQDALSPLGLLAAVLPELLARAAGARYVVFEWYGYPGALLVVAVALALAARRLPRGWGASLLLALAALLLAVGPTVGLTSILATLVPGYGQLRCHCRELTMVFFFLLPLAGAGAQQLWELSRRAGGAGKIRWLVGVGASLLLLQAAVRLALGSASGTGADWIPWTNLALASALLLLALRPHPAFFLLLAALHLLDVGAPARGLARFAEVERWTFAALPEASAVLENDGDWYRFWAHEDLVNPNHGVDIQRRSILGYENQFPNRYAQYVATLAGLPEARATTNLSPGLVEQVEDPFLFTLLGVRYAFLPERPEGLRPGPPMDLGGQPPAPPPGGGDHGPTPVRGTLQDPSSGGADRPGMLPTTRPEDRAWNLRRDPDHLPRASLLGAWRVLGSPDEVLAAVASPDFDPRVEALLERSPTWPSSANEPASSSSVLSTTERGVNRLEIELEVAEPSLLLLSELFHPGWHATLDGEPAPTLRADYLLRAVAVPAGARELSMRYTPRGLFGGLLLSLISLAVALLPLLPLRRLRSTRPGEPS